MTISITSPDQSTAWVAASTKTMQRAGRYARESMASSRTDDALRHAAALLGELRSVLLPAAYFELWTIATGELATMETYFARIMADGDDAGRRYDDVVLYNKVQSAGNVLPRLYLLFTVGSVTLKRLAANAREASGDDHGVDVPALLTDMEALCKGVQHPVRGLFLRAYLLQSVKSALYVDTVASVEFLLENFVEMNKLWVRMKYGDDDAAAGVLAHSPISIRTHREQLADLVGKNLLYLAELVSLEEFAGDVLGRILDQVVSCRDTVAQTYLMECITAVFPDEFQIATMDQLLSVLPKLDATVEMAAVLGSMLDRLATYSQADSDAFRSLDEMDAFAKIADAVETAVLAHGERMSGEAVVSMYGGLLTFAGAVYPGRVAYVEEVLGKCVLHFDGRVEGGGVEGGGVEGGSAALGADTGTGTGGSRARIGNEPAVPEKKLVELLCIPLEKYDLATALNIGQFIKLVNVLGDGKRKELAYKVASMVPQREEVVRDAASARALVGVLESLYGAGADEDDARTMSKALRFIRVDDPSEHVRLLCEMVEGFKVRDAMVRVVGPAVVLSALDAVERFAVEDCVDKGEHRARVGEALVFVVSLCTRIADAGSGSEAVGLLLRVVAAAAEGGDGAAGGDGNGNGIMSSIVYECMEQACRIFEETVYDAAACKTTLADMIAVLPTIDAVLSEVARDMVHHKVASYCAKLLLRKDQCHMLVSLARVERDGPRIVARLRRAERIVSAIQEQDAVFQSSRSPEQLAVPGILLVEILDAWMYHNRLGVVEATDDEVRRVAAAAEALVEGHADGMAYLIGVRDAC